MITEKEPFDQFLRRYSYGKSIKRLDSLGAHAGSPFYFYCLHCGIPTEIFPEKPFFTPSECCTQCKSLLEKGDLEKAKDIVKSFFNLTEEL